MTLEEQIRQRWGQYGNWQSADQNQTAALARLFEANGITDLSKLSFKKREYEAPGQEWETEAGMVRYRGRAWLPARSSGTRGAADVSLTDR